MNFIHTRKQSSVCFLRNGNLFMVFKGKLFFLNFWAPIDYCKLLVLFADEEVSNMVQINVIEWQNRQNQSEIQK